MSQDDALWLNYLVLRPLNHSYSVSGRVADPCEVANCGNYVHKRPADAVLNICCASSDSLYCYKNDGRITLWKFEGSGKFSL